MNCDLEKMKKAGIIHKNVKNFIQENIKENMKLLDLANLIENKIKEECKYDCKMPLNTGIGFPTGLSINDCAAHWTPHSYSDKVLGKTDIIKIDYGVHIDGSIIDSAFSYSFSNKYDKLMEASRTSTDIAIKMMRPDTLLSEVGKAVEENMNSYEFMIGDKNYKVKPVRSLCGHTINKYRIHGGKCIPNIYMKEYTERVKEGEFYAVETFATTGSGETYEDLKDCSHYMVNYMEMNKMEKVKNNCNDFYKIIKKYYNTLAFCDRWLVGRLLSKKNKLEKLDNNSIKKYMSGLKGSNIIEYYPPIYDVDKTSYVSQFEESIYIGNECNIILSDQ